MCIRDRFVVFKAFNMEALAMGGFVALLIGGIFCKSYTKFWDSAIRGISSISSEMCIRDSSVVGPLCQAVRRGGGGHAAGAACARAHRRACDHPLFLSLIHI